jgi:UDP-3-O-[3-hydroxymyristoyl] N-acetylglucosamine deacetylase
VLRIDPAPLGTGLVFVDHLGAVIAEAQVEQVTAASGWARLDGRLPPQVPPAAVLRNTTLGSASGRVAATVEHVLSALAGLHVADARITLEGDEVPILDGSALPFARALAEVLAPAPPRQAITVAAPLRVERDKASIEISPLGPGEGAEYVYELDYGPGAAIPPSRATWRPFDAESAAAYLRDIAPARTFSLRAEAEQARALGLFTHLTPRDMVVVGEDGMPIDNAWRGSGEPARHKLLDLIGDLALLGAPLAAKVIARRAGHALTHEAARAVRRGEHHP